MYFPAAFEAASLQTISSLVPKQRRIEVGEADAMAFACTAVEIVGKIYMNDCSSGLRTRVNAAGLSPAVTQLSEFLKAAGAAK